MTSRPRRRRRALLLAAGATLAVLGLVVLRVALASSAAFDRGEAYAAEGRSELAALAYREAITWYYPGNPHATTAIERLWALADAAEATGDLVGARILVGDLRGALYAIRHVVQPHETEVRQCDERLARLLAATDERVLRGELSPETVYPAYREDTARDHAPAVGWSLALGLGFLGWIGTTIVGIRRLVPPDDAASLRWRPAAPWAAASLACLTLWMLGAALA